MVTSGAIEYAGNGPRAEQGNMFDYLALTDNDNIFFFSSRRRHTIFYCDWSSDVCSSDLGFKSLRETIGEYHLLEAQNSPKVNYRWPPLHASEVRRDLWSGSNLHEALACVGNYRMFWSPKDRKSVV